MAGITEADIVRIARKGTILTYFYFTESLPALQGIAGELEGAVFNELCVEAAVCGVVDVLKENTIQGGRNGCTGFFEVDIQLMGLRQGGKGKKRRGKCQDDFSHINRLSVF